MSFGERPAQRRATMAASAEADLLSRILPVSGLHS